MNNGAPTGTGSDKPAQQDTAKPVHQPQTAKPQPAKRRVLPAAPYVEPDGAAPAKPPKWRCPV